MMMMPMPMQPTFGMQPPMGSLFSQMCSHYVLVQIPLITPRAVHTDEGTHAFRNADAAFCDAAGLCLRSQAVQLRRRAAHGFDLESFLPSVVLPRVTCHRHKPLPPRAACVASDPSLIAGSVAGDHDAPRPAGGCLWPSAAPVGNDELLRSFGP